MNFKEISIGETIADSLSQKEGKGYVVAVDANRKLTIDLKGPADQDFDLYIKFNEQASPTKWDFKRTTTKADETITIGPTSAGSYYILVYAYRGLGQFKLSTEVPLEDVEIGAGQQIKGTLHISKESLYYFIKSEEGQKISLDLNGPINADFDLYVSFGQRPNNIKYDYRSYGGTSRENIVIEKARKGIYYIMVHSYSGSGDFTLSAASTTEETGAVELIISSKDNLKSKYGPSGLAEIEAKIAEYAKALQAAGISPQLVYVDDASSLSAHGLSPVNPNSPEKIKELMDDLDRKLSPRYFLILGGHSIIPFHSLKNPAASDGDAIVYSDNPYASRDSDYLIPERALGRLPDGSGSQLSFFLAVLEKAASRTRKAAKISFGQTASVWTEASKAVFVPIKNAQDLKISPPVNHGEVQVDWLDRKGYFYFNLHGGEDSANWYGQEDSSYPVAFTPDNIKDADVKDAVVCCEACYGANIVDKGVDDALSLKFLDRNAACFVGSTKIAYGPCDPPSTEADLLVLKFFERIKEGLTFGDAFMKAKQDFARQSVADRNRLDKTEEKTLIEFVMFADPSSKMEEA